MKKRRRWWPIALAVVIVVAAGATAGVLWLGRSKTPAVRYLTATAATGTIAETVQADFTLAAAQGTTTIALGGSLASTSGSTTSGSNSTTSTSSSSVGSRSPIAPGSAVTTYATLTLSTPTPTPTPSRTATSTPTPTPTPSKSGEPSPRPTASGGTGGGSGASTGARSGSSTSSSSSTSSTSASGVVTHVGLPVGATPRTLERLLTVSGKPVFAFVSSSPLYKTLSIDLSSGSQVANVKALQRALKGRGYYTGSVSGAFGSSTETALKAWQADQGLSQTGQITTSRFVWVPKGCVLYSWSVDLGSRVGSGTALATVGAPRDLIAQALVSQADIASLKVGQKAQLTIDGYTSGAFTATISSIGNQPASSSSSVGSSSSTEYTVTLRPHGMPKLARSGMTGTLEVVIAQRKNVLLVPTSAVSGTSTVPYVRVMMNGVPALRQVQTGMATSAYTQIIGGLTAGEVVITGQYSNTAASTTTGGSGGFGVPGFGGAGTFRGSGSSNGPGGFPGAPGGGQ